MALGGFSTLGGRPDTSRLRTALAVARGGQELDQGELAFRFALVFDEAHQLVYRLVVQRLIREPLVEFLLEAAGVALFAFLDVGHELKVDERAPPFQAGHGLVIGFHEHVGGFL